MERLDYLIDEFSQLENPDSGWSWAIEEAFRCVVKAKLLYITWRDEEY